MKNVKSEMHRVGLVKGRSYVVVYLRLCGRYRQLYGGLSTICYVAVYQKLCGGFSTNGVLLDGQVLGNSISLCSGDG